MNTWKEDYEEENALLAKILTNADKLSQSKRL